MRSLFNNRISPGPPRPRRRNLQPFLKVVIDDERSSRLSLQWPYTKDGKPNLHYVVQVSKIGREHYNLFGMISS